MKNLTVLIAISLSSVACSLQSNRIDTQDRSITPAESNRGSLRRKLGLNADCQMTDLEIRVTDRGKFAASYNLHGCTRNQRNLIKLNISETLQRHYNQVSVVSHNITTH